MHLGLICRRVYVCVCEWTIAWVLVIFSFYLNCELFLKCEVKTRHGFLFVPSSRWLNVLKNTNKIKTLCEWCKITKNTFTSKFEMYNCLISSMKLRKRKKIKIKKRSCRFPRCFCGYRLRAPWYFQNFLLSIKLHLL